ncbi:MAG: hypothetical protein ACXV7J_01110 [Methylomonas sp.]
MKKISRSIIFTLLTTLLTACVNPYFGGESVILATPRTPQFDFEKFSNQQTAVFHTVTAVGQFGYAPELSITLDSALNSTSVPIKYIPSQTVISILNNKNLSQRYSELIGNYQKSGILDREHLTDIAEALGVNYVFLPIFANFSQQMDDRLVLMGLSASKTHTSRLGLSLQLWDARDGSLVWQSSGESTLTKESIATKPASLSDTAQKLWVGILEDLISGQTVSRYSSLQEFMGIR